VPPRIPPQSWQLVPASTGYYKIQSVGSGLALDVQDGSTAAGAVVTQANWSGVTSQQWSLSMVTDLDETAWYTVTNRNSGLTLGVTGGPAATQPGTAVEQEVPANMTSQRWRLLPGNATGSYVMLTQHTTFAPGPGGCLDLAGGATAPGTPAVLNTRDGAASQSWQLLSAEPGVFRIQNLTNGLVLQAGTGPSALAPGVATQVAAWTGADNQKWWLTR
jgi:Ricin-type beta-trefoil lectin domain-like